MRGKVEGDKEINEQEYKPVFATDTEHRCILEHTYGKEYDKSKKKIEIYFYCFLHFVR